MKQKRSVLGFYRDKGKTKPITKSAAELNRKKFIQPNGSRWTLTYKRTRQLKDLSRHFLEKYKPKCYFCHQPLLPKDLPDNITEHHINGNHNDNRPANKALCHETCHRKYNYDVVRPRNLGSGTRQQVDGDQSRKKY